MKTPSAGSVKPTIMNGIMLTIGSFLRWTFVP